MMVMMVMIANDSSAFELREWFQALSRDSTRTIHVFVLRDTYRQI